jgi:hypothetical protein
MYTTTVPVTLQARSFAIAFLDATTLYLDGAAEIGSNRAEKFSNAKRRAVDAIAYTDVEIEREMAQAFIDKIEDFQMRGLHV